MSSSYVYSSNLSYADYLQTKEFITELSDGSRAIEHTVSSNGREVVATIEDLNRANCEVFGEVADTINMRLDAGFERIAIRLDDIGTELRELNATFHWGFSNLLASVGRANDTLEQLLMAAKTPTQTWAYEQYEMARDAMRSHLYAEALELLNRAIDGYGSNAGYKLEWRFHYSKGLIHLGDVYHADSSLIDLEKAEAAFLAAARYAHTQSVDASNALVAAGWAAYCRGNFEKAREHTANALELASSLPEANFQIAKIDMRLNRLDNALPELESAIKLDRRYAIRALDDGDFQTHEIAVESLLNHLREETEGEAKRALSACTEAIRHMESWQVGSNISEFCESSEKADQAEALFNRGTYFGFLDSLSEAQEAKRLAFSAVDTQKLNLKNDLEARKTALLKKQREIKPLAMRHASDEYHQISGELESVIVTTLNSYDEYASLNNTLEIAAKKISDVAQHADRAYSNKRAAASATGGMGGLAVGAFLCVFVMSILFLPYSCIAVFFHHILESLTSTETASLILSLFTIVLALVCLGICMRVGWSKGASWLTSRVRRK